MKKNRLKKHKIETVLLSIIFIIIVVNFAVTRYYIFKRKMFYP